MPEENTPPEQGSNDIQSSSVPAFAANEKIAKVNVADEIKNSFLDYSDRKSTRLNSSHH